jgi:hypothetical protein
MTKTLPTGKTLSIHHTGGWVIPQTAGHFEEETSCPCQELKYDSSDAQPMA